MPVNAQIHGVDIGLEGFEDGESSVALKTKAAYQPLKRRGAKSECIKSLIEKTWGTVRMSSMGLQ